MGVPLSYGLIRANLSEDYLALIVFPIRHACHSICPYVLAGSATYPFSPQRARCPYTHRERIPLGRYPVLTPQGITANGVITVHRENYLHRKDAHRLIASLGRSLPAAVAFLLSDLNTIVVPNA